MQQKCTGSRGQSVEEREVSRGFGVPGEGVNMREQRAGYHSVPTPMLAKSLVVLRIVLFPWLRSSREQEQKRIRKESWTAEKGMKASQ